MTPMRHDWPMDLVNQDPDVITIWSDVSCPWATLALHTLHQAAAQAGADIAIDHRAFPLELINRKPTPKQGHDIEVAAIAAVRPDLQWRAWDQPDATYPVTTLPALEAVQAAKRPEVGGLQASDQLDTALRRAFFVEHRCISLHPVIHDVAEQCPAVDADALRELMRQGVGRQDVYDQWRTATEAEVPGSPSLYNGGGHIASNPGVDLEWVAGFPRINGYDASWADRLSPERR
jgi:predicted DsbA family dithiol-disulfide isomerase